MEGAKKFAGFERSAEVRHERPTDLVIVAGSFGLPACAACGVILRPQAARGMARRWCSTTCRSWRARNPHVFTYRPRDAASIDAETVDTLTAWTGERQFIEDPCAALLRLLRSTQSQPESSADD